MGLTDMGNMHIHTPTHTNQCLEVKLGSDNRHGNVEQLLRGTLLSTSPLSIEDL